MANDVMINIGEYDCECFIFSALHFISLSALDDAYKKGIYEKDFVIEKIKNTIKHEFTNRNLIVFSKELSKSMKPKDLATAKDKMLSDLRDCSDYRSIIKYLKQIN